MTHFVSSLLFLSVGQVAAVPKDHPQKFVGIFRFLFWCNYLDNKMKFIKLVFPECIKYFLPLFTPLPMLYLF